MACFKTNLAIALSSSFSNCIKYFHSSIYEDMVATAGWEVGSRFGEEPRRRSKIKRSSLATTEENVDTIHDMVMNDWRHVTYHKVNLVGISHERVPVKIILRNKLDMTGFSTRHSKASDFWWIQIHLQLEFMLLWNMSSWFCCAFCNHAYVMGSSLSVRD